MIRRVLLLLALIAVVALPFLFRPKTQAPGKADDTLVIITPHNEAIRHEFTEGFRAWHQARTGRTAAIDWRVIGGSSDIGRFLDSEYVAVFRNYWTNQVHRPWSTEVQAGFTNPNAAAVSPAAGQAREAFMASEVSCGIDLFFGGGSYDYIQQADAGRIVPTQLLTRHPDWFTDEVVPKIFTGERYWDDQGRWFGNVVSVYGILYNNDALKRLGFESAPAQWSALADPRFVGEVALADPTKSSSIAKAFENLVQQCMQRRLAELRTQRADASAGDAAGLEPQAVREGWREGLELIQRIGANARYFTDSSQKVPIDVGQGDCAAGICIDFYGRSQAEAAEQRDRGTPRLTFVSPPGGTVAAVDPIAVLRGAPHRALAEEFIEYTLTLEGQKLWNFKPGTPGGPTRFALRRLPVRRDFYAHEEWKPLRSDPNANPFDQKEPLIYRPQWTSGLFRELAFVTRVMCQDTHRELVEAWRAIIAAGEPRAALAELTRLEAVSYDETRTTIKAALSAKDKSEELKLAKKLGELFRGNYARAKAIAEGARKAPADAR